MDAVRVLDLSDRGVDDEAGELPKGTDCECCTGIPADSDDPADVGLPRSLGLAMKQVSCSVLSVCVWSVCGG